MHFLENYCFLNTIKYYCLNPLILPSWLIEKERLYYTEDFYLRRFLFKIFIYFYLRFLFNFSNGTCFSGWKSVSLPSESFFTLERGDGYRMYPKKDNSSWLT